jgi:hypothetical protein
MMPATPTQQHHPHQNRATPAEEHISRRAPAEEHINANTATARIMTTSNQQSQPSTIIRSTARAAILSNRASSATEEDQAS